MSGIMMEPGINSDYFLNIIVITFIMLRTFIFLLVLFLIDLYVFNGIRFLCKNLQPFHIRIIYTFFWGVSLISFGIIISAYFTEWHQWQKAVRTYLFAFVFVTYFSKLFFVLFLIVDDVFRLFRWIWEQLAPVSSETSSSFQESAKPGVKRSEFLIRLGIILAAIPFTALILGMIRGKYAYRIRNLQLTFDKLPEVFNGFKIVHISDLHTGSFMDSAPIEKAVAMINDLKPDLIVFTGDLVNDLQSEVVPYREALSKLFAPHGVMSILGNHDYGDYYRWKTREDKSENLKNLIKLQREMGWDLLLDEHRYIERNGEKISIIGVQNWSARNNFSSYGNLVKALNRIEFSPVNILLSHDPSHWKAEVLGKIKEIDLTLSGHTHGFQFGVEIPGFKWSPVQYVYTEWADLYSHQNQHLYVNRGLGFIGYPGRVGIMPEITAIVLSR